jgi:hypothetical protein
MIGCSDALSLSKGCPSLSGSAEEGQGFDKLSQTVLGEIV